MSHLELRPADRELLIEVARNLTGLQPLLLWKEEIMSQLTELTDAVNDCGAKVDALVAKIPADDSADLAALTVKLNAANAKLADALVVVTLAFG